MLKIDGFDGALIGMANVWQRHPSGGAEVVSTLVYSGTKIIETLVRESGCSFEEAEEYVSYNIEGAYVGPATPIIVWEGSLELAEVHLNG